MYGMINGWFALFGLILVAGFDIDRITNILIAFLFIINWIAEDKP